MRRTAPAVLPPCPPRYGAALPLAVACPPLFPASLAPMPPHPRPLVPLALQGGYKAFWRSFSEMCEGGYTPMDHPDFTHQLKVRPARAVEDVGLC